MFDIIFISYNEPNADYNWNELNKNSYLNDIIPERIHGIKGIAKAHKEAAKIVNTEYFFCVDADNLVNKNFKWKPELISRGGEFIDNRVHVWSCINSVNGLNYGYGGVKLFPTQLVLDSNENVLDYCTTVAKDGMKIYNEIASTTYFNTSPFDAWRSGFRECVKLSSQMINNPDSETLKRLKIWCNIGIDSIYGNYTILGSRIGTLYGTENAHDIEKLKIINDYNLCKTLFDDRYIIQDVELKLKHYGYNCVNFDNEQSILIKEMYCNG